MKKTLPVILIFVALFFAWRLSAQFGVEQSFWKRELVSEIAIGTNLAHRWTQLDLPTNQAFNTWTDRITGTHFLGTFIKPTSPWTPHVMSNTAGGVLFASAGSALTNQWGTFSNLWLIGDSSSWTNWAVGYILSFNRPLESLRGFSMTGVNGWSPYYAASGEQISWGYAGQSWSANSDTREIWPITNNYFEIVFGSTNRQNVPNSARGFTYVNGHLSTNYTSDGQTHLPPKNFGLYDVSGYPVPDTYGARMYLREIWVRTNKLENASQIDAFVADLHRANQTLYGAPLDTATNTPIAIYDANALNFNDGDLVDSWTNSKSAYPNLNLISSGSARPYYTNDAAEINGQGYIHFDGVDDNLRTNDTVVYSQPTYIVVVARTEAMPGVTRNFFDNGATMSQATYMINEDGGMYFYAGTQIGATIGATRIHNWKIWEFSFTGSGGAGGASWCRTNGVYPTTAVGDAGTNGRKGVSIGASFGAANFSKINVAWMGIFTNYPNWYNRSNLVYQLSNRYGITAYYP